MERRFDPPLTDEELRMLALHYIYHQLASKNHSKVDYGPQWVRLASNQDRLVILNTGCDCMGEDHNLTVGIDYDDDYDQPAIHFWSTLSCYSDTFNAWENAFDRRKRAKKGQIPDGLWDNTIIWITKWPGVAKILWRRFISACKFLFTGHIEWEGGITFKDDKHIEDLHLALWWAQAMVTREGKDWRKKHIARYQNAIPDIDVEEWSRWAAAHMDEVREYLTLKTNLIIDDQVNQCLIKQGFKLPPLPEGYESMTAEEIYEKLKDSTPEDDDDIPVSPV